MKNDCKSKNCKFVAYFACEHILPQPKILLQNITALLAKGERKLRLGLAEQKAIWGRYPKLKKV